MEYLILLEPTNAGFSVQVPDLAIVTYGADVAAARAAAVEAIRVNLEAYGEAGQDVPPRQPVLAHLENPEFRDLLFTYVDLPEFEERVAA